MPLFQYFGWVGSFLLAALFAANWCCSAPISRAPRSDFPRDQKINIRIHTDHKWPERVVFDTAFDVDGRSESQRGDRPWRKRNSRSGGTPILRRVRRDGGYPRQAVFSTAMLRRPDCGTGGVAD
jgi:hypothetical protein